jgi:hypothetical protein
MLSDVDRWLVSVAIAAMVVATVHYLARRIGQKRDKQDHDDGYPRKRRRPWHDQQ